ncbi:MAG: hypothetical protein WAX38_00700 [Minisyncoccia bacterium]
MNVVSVIPIQRGMGIEELTYFTIREVHPGALVTVPVRSASCIALVVSVHAVEDIKTHLKNQNFQLKKMGADAPRQILSAQFIASIESIANFHAATSGSVLFSLLPKVIIDNYQILPTLPPASISTKTSIIRRYALQSEFKERCISYKNLARESLAKQESIFFMVPEQRIGQQLQSEIEKGIEKHVIFLHAGTTKKKLLEFWSRIATETAKAVVIIGTPQYLSLPVTPTTIVIEAEASTAYVRMERPFLDMRVVAEIIAETSGARIIYADTLLRMQTFAEIEAGLIEAYAPLQQKIRGTATTTITSKSPEESKKTFSSAFHTKIVELKNLHVHMAFIIARKNIATSVICTDCGTRCICSVCGGPQRLSTRIRTDERILVCARCGASESAHTTCKNCGGWKLKMYGVTTESVARMLSAEFGDMDVAIFEANKKSNNEILQKLAKGKKPVCVVGTVALLPYVHEFHTVLIPSLEGFLSAPTFAADEDTIRLMAHIREQVHTELVIETSQTGDTPLITQLRDGELTSFLREELPLRNSLRLPPSATEITLTISGKREPVVAAIKSMITTLQPWKPRAHKELTRISSTTVSHETKIYVPRSTWPSEQLVNALRALPQQFSIKIS